mgnify:CR=1
MNDVLPDDIVIERCLTLGTIRNDTIPECEEGVILADTYIGTWKGSGTALAENDLTDGDLLAMIDLNPKVFWV